MPVEVKRNTFYKAEVPTVGIPLEMAFSDLAATENTATGSTFKLVGGSLNTAYVLEGQVADYPTYGKGELVGGFLMLKNVSSDMENNRTVPALGAYRVRPDLQISDGMAKGNYFLATLSGAVDSFEGPQVGDRITLINSLPVSDIPTLSDSFEGGLEGITTKTAANAVTRFARPYITETNLKQLFKDHGFYSNDKAFAKQTTYLMKVTRLRQGHGIGESVRGYTLVFTANEKVKLQTWLMGSSSGAQFAELMLRNPIESMLGSWKTVGANIFGGGKNPGKKYGIAKYNAILKDYSKTELYNKGYIEYAFMNTTSGDMDNNTQANQSNTIFNEVASNLDENNPWSATNDAPLILSTVELSPEKALEGGQAMRFYHTWDHSPNNIEWQAGVGGSFNLNPTCTSASIYNIPMPPPPFDAGQSTYNANVTGTYILGNMRSVAPEIRLAMNISKLAANVPLNGGGDKDDNASTDISGAIAFMGENIGAPGVIDNDEMSHFENTFLRSIVVTFSNYKPKSEHTTLDKFLTYGLSRFYNAEETENIVGGVVFTSFDYSITNMTDIAAPDVQVAGTSVPDVYAFPLPVTSVQSQVTSSNGFTVGNVLASGGIARAVGKVGGNYKNLDTCIWGVTPVVSGAGDAQISMVNEDGPLRSVKLPADSWFNMRIFTDINQKNSAYVTSKRPYSVSGTNNPTLASITDRGVPMRVVFDTTTTENDVVIDSDSRYLPFLDIPFPQGLAGGTSPATYPSGCSDPWSFADKPHLFPRHMTIWVQNYPWFSGNTADDGSSGVPFFTGDNVLQGSTSGSATEVELFLDKIQFLNYGPGLNVFSAGHGNSNLSFKPKSHKSPLTTMISGASSSVTTPKYFLKRWIGSRPITITGQCLLTNASPNVELLTTSGTFDLGHIENAATVTSGLAGGSTFSDDSDVVTVTATGIPANTYMGIDDAFNFTMYDLAGSEVDSTVGSPTVADVVFTSFGTLEPPINKADLNEYSVGQNVCMGFNEKAYLPLSDDDYVAECSGNLLFNDFNTQSYSQLKTNPLKPDKIYKLTNTSTFAADTAGAILSVDAGNWDSDSIELGGQMNAPAYYISGTTTGSALSGAQFPVSYSAVSNGITIITGATTNVTNDGFRQKGFIHIAPSGGDNGFSDWVKRENIAASTRVLGTSGFDPFDHTKGLDSELGVNQIRVADPTIFNWTDADETYVIYIAGATNATSNKLTGLKLAQDAPLAGDIVSFSENLYYADDGFTAIVSLDNLPRLMISPEKYWITMMFDTPSTLIERNYESACMIAQEPALSTCSGTTLNEWLFSMDNSVAATGGAAGQYARPWNLYPELDNETLVLDTDFGSGVFDEEENETGGMFIEGPIYQGLFMPYQMRDVVKSNLITPGAALPLIIYPAEDTIFETTYTFNGPAAGNVPNKPTFYWEFKDAPPVISNLTVKGYLDVEKEDLYSLKSQNLNSVEFSWEEEDADDIWYRMLMVSDTPIGSKYADAVMWVPLNESFPDLNAAPTGYTVYNPSNGTSGAVTIGTGVRPIIYGQGGWAPLLSDSSTGNLEVPSGTNAGMKNLTEFTLVVHATFGTADLGSRAGVVSHVVTAGSSAAGNFRMYKDASDQIVVELGADVAITGSAVVECDGDTPTAMIVTFNSGSVEANKAKLYIDGVLVGVSTGSTYATTDSNFHIGGAYSVSKPVMTGFIEEIVLYNKEYHIVGSSPYVYNTANLVDISGSHNVTYNARLIVPDYHNFRGSSPRHIGMSNQTSWRPTTV